MSTVSSLVLVLFHCFKVLEAYRVSERSTYSLHNAYFINVFEFKFRCYACEAVTEKKESY